MSGNLEQLDPNYVVAFDYSKENVARLVSGLESHGLETVTRPGHNSKTVYAFTKVQEPGVFESGEAFTEKHPQKHQHQQQQEHQRQDKDQQPQQEQAKPREQQKELNITPQEKQSFPKPEERKQDRGFGPVPADTAEIAGDKKKQSLLSKAQDTAKGAATNVQDQGGVQGLKDKAGKIPGSDKVEGDLKKKIPGDAGAKMGGVGGAVGGALGGGSSGGGSGGGAKDFASQAKGGLKGFNKDDLVKGSQDVFNNHKDQLADAGKKAAQGDTSGLESVGKDVAKDVSGRVDKDQLMNSGKKMFSGDKKDLLKNGKQAFAKNQVESQGKDVLSGAVGKGGGLGDAAGAAGATGAAGSFAGQLGKNKKSDDLSTKPSVGEFEEDSRGALGGSQSGQNGFKKDTDLSQGSLDVDTPGATESSLGSNAAVKGFSRGTSSSPVPKGNEKATSSTVGDSKNPFAGPAAKTTFSAPLGSSPSTSNNNVVGGGRATLFSIIDNFDFVQSVTPIYDVEKRKKLETTVSELIQEPSLTPSDNELTNLEHLTRNPREILYFFYFKNYIRWLLPVSLIGVVCRLFSRAVAPWEFNITYTSLLIIWSLLFTSSWIFYFEPLYANKLGKVLGVVAPSGKQLSSPHVVLYKKFAFVPVALLFALSLVGFQFFCFFIEIFITQLYSGPFSSILALLPAVLISAIVPVLTLVYNKVFVNPLVNWENGPDPKKSKTQKNFILTFLTSYVPLFITLFVYFPLGHKFTPDLQKGVASYAQKYRVPVVASDFIVDINRYKKQFFYYTVTAQIINMVMENALPLVLDAVLPALVKDGKRSQGDVIEKIDSIIQSRYPGDIELWKKVQSFHSTNYGEFDVDQNYSKLVVQFGYIAMFSIIWPLAPLIFTIFDLVIFRADLWRAFTKSKPSSRPTDLQVAKGGAHKVHVSAAPWNGILEKTTYLGSIVSVTLLLMYRYSNLPGVGLSTSLEKRDNWYRESPLVFSWSKILLAAVVVEHLVLLGYVYTKEILVSYQTKFEAAVLPSVELQSEPNYNKEVEETAAIMDEVAYEPVEQPKPKAQDSQQKEYTDKDVSNLDNTDNVSSGAKSTGAEVYGDGGYSYDYDGGYAPHGGRDAADSIPGLSSSSASYGKNNDDGYTKGPDFDAGYKDGYARGSGDNDESATTSGFYDGYGREPSTGSKRKGFGKPGDQGNFNDDLTAGAVGGLGAANLDDTDASSDPAAARKVGSSRGINGHLNGAGVSRNGNKSPSGLSHSRSTKRSSTHTGSSLGEKSRSSEKGAREFGGHTTSAKESNLSAQGNGKGTSSTPQVVADSGSREIPLQSQGVNDLNSAGSSKSPASKASKNLGAAGAGAGLGGVAGAAGGAGISDGERSTKQRGNRESYVAGPSLADDAGATVPEPVPTSRNYGSRSDRSGNFSKTSGHSDFGPSTSYNGNSVNGGNTVDGTVAGGAVGGAAGGLGGLASGAAGDLKSGKVPKATGDIGKDFQNDAVSGVKSGKLPKGGDIGKDLQKDIPKDIGSSVAPGGKPSGGGGVSDSLGNVAQKGGTDAGKGQSVSDAMKTLDPAAVASSAGNIAKDPSSAPQEVGNLAQQGAPVASAVWANRSKGSKQAAQGVDDSTTGASSLGKQGSRNDGFPQNGGQSATEGGGFGAGNGTHGAHEQSYDRNPASQYGTQDSYNAREDSYGKGDSSGVNQDNTLKENQKYVSEKRAGGTRYGGADSREVADDRYDFEEPNRGRGVYAAGASGVHDSGNGGVDPESPAAQQFGRDVHSFKSGGTYGTAESKIGNLTGAGGASEGIADTEGATGGGAAGADSGAGVHRNPQRSATKPRREPTRPKAGGSKSSTPSRSKTIGHSSQAKREAASPKTADAGGAQRGASNKGPKERSSNPELRSNQANSSHEGKSKHKSGLLHRIIKKLE